MVVLFSKYRCVSNTVRNQVAPKIEAARDAALAGQGRWARIAPGVLDPRDVSRLPQPGWRPEINEGLFWLPSRGAGHIGLLVTNQGQLIRVRNYDDAFEFSLNCRQTELTTLVNCSRVATRPPITQYSLQSAAILLMDIFNARVTSRDVLLPAQAWENTSAISTIGDYNIPRVPYRLRRGYALGTSLRGSPMPNNI